MNLLSLLPDILQLILNLIDVPSKICLSNVCVFFHQNVKREKVKDLLCTLAAEKGYTSIIRWTGPTYRLNGLTCIVAAEYGHLDTLQFVLSQITKPSCVLQLVGAAAKNGHFNVVKWLVENYECSRVINNHSQHVVDNTAYAGYFDIVRYLVEHNFIYSYITIVRVIRSDNLEMLKFLKMYQPIRKVSKVTICRMAIYYGRINIFQLYMKPHMVRDSSFCLYAIKGGQLDALKWLRSQNPRYLLYIDEAFKEAREKGFIEIEEWLHNNEEAL